VALSEPGVSGDAHQSEALLKCDSFLLVVVAFNLLLTACSVAVVVVLLVACLGLAVVRGAKKCYTRTLVTCATNADKGGVIDYKVTARADAFLDLRLGPVADRPHSWRVVWAKDRAMRCMPSLTLETNPVEATLCGTSEYEQLPLGWAGRGVTYFRVLPCAGAGAKCNAECETEEARFNKSALCTENFTLYADDCSVIDITEVTPEMQPDVEYCPRLGMDDL
jgi:hypothetical protein